MAAAAIATGIRAAKRCFRLTLDKRSRSRHSTKTPKCSAGFFCVERINVKIRIPINLQAGLIDLNQLPSLQFIDHIGIIPDQLTVMGR